MRTKKKIKKIKRCLNFSRVCKNITSSSLERNIRAYTHRFIYVHTIFISDCKETCVCHIEKTNDLKMKGIHTYKCISICSKIFIRDIYPMIDQYREVHCNNLLTFPCRTKRFPFLSLFLLSNSLISFFFFFFLNSPLKFR